MPKLSRLDASSSNNNFLSTWPLRFSFDWFCTKRGFFWHSWKQILFLSADHVTPVVIWHGLGQSCCDPAAIGRVKMIIANVTKAYVVSIKVSRPSSQLLGVICRRSGNFVEEIYTYKNTSRSGSLGFKVVVDHPSILNLLTREHFKGMSDAEADNYINAFFAGCQDVDFYELIKTYTQVVNPLQFLKKKSLQTLPNFQKLVQH